MKSTKAGDFYVKRKTEFAQKANPCISFRCPDIDAEDGRESREYFGDCMALNMNKYLLRKKVMANILTCRAEFGCLRFFLFFFLSRF